MLLNSGPVSLGEPFTDQLGRTVRKVEVKGSDIAPSMIDQGLAQYLPADHQQLYCWVYGAEGVPAGNAGYQRRARDWNHSASTLTIHTPFPQPVVAQGVYEIHLRLRRDRYVEALNQAIMQLQLSWYRPVIDESIMTQVNHWEYPLPSTYKWTQLHRVEIQTSIAPEMVGYPYRGADYLNWKVDRYVADDRTVQYLLRFAYQPPPERKLRLYGEAMQQRLTNEDDLLVLDDQWAEPARNWILQYAQWLCLGWEAQRQPAGQADRYLMLRDRLLQDKKELLKLKPVHANARLKVPGRGDASLPFFHGDSYFGVFGDPH